MASANVNDSSSASSQTTEKSSAAGVPMPDDLPNTIMIRDAPRELFEDAEQKANFASLFQGIDPNCQMVFLKSFQRVRVKFGSIFEFFGRKQIHMILEKPEHATAAKLFLEHHSFNGLKMKGFLVKVFSYLNLSVHRVQGCKEWAY